MPGAGKAHGRAPQFTAAHGLTTTVNVVMVHGFADTGGLFKRMSERLEAEGHRCHSPTLHPRDARLGIPDLSAKLAAYVGASVPRGAPLAIVGFSMGSLVARHFLQELGGAASASAFFSISGPHGGTFAAYLHPGIGARQMRPGSPFLRLQGDRAGAIGGLPVFTYRTPLDLMVVPPSSTRIGSAPELVVWCPFHALMPGNPRVIGHIAAELARLEAGARIRVVDDEL
jgi:triacylglycerol lipase